MAKKTTKAAPARRNAAPKPATERRVVREATVAATTGSGANHLLREAAWSRMFGRVELKNPFTR
jgi:hypothetical protein